MKQPPSTAVWWSSRTATCGPPPQVLIYTNATCAGSPTCQRTTGTRSPTPTSPRRSRRSSGSTTRPQTQPPRDRHFKHALRGCGGGGGGCGGHRQFDGQGRSAGGGDAEQEGAGGVVGVQLRQLEQAVRVGGQGAEGAYGLAVRVLEVGA